MLLWHVTSRGNERRDIFRSDQDRLFFLDTLAEVVRVFRWILHAWVCMDNHFHLQIETPIPTLSLGMKRLNEVYAGYFNAVHHRVGHLFQGRFKAILVERESHLLELCRYVVLNPVRAGMVETAGEYRWSNYRATAGLRRPPGWLDVEWTLSRFRGTTVGEHRQAYRHFVADARGSKYNPWEQLVGQIFLGGEAFCDRMQKLIDQRPRSREHPKSQRQIVRPSFDAIVEEVSAAFGETGETIWARSRRPARKALANLASEEAGLTFAAIGNWLGLTGEAAKLGSRSAAGSSNAWMTITPPPSDGSGSPSVSIGRPVLTGATLARTLFFYFWV